MEKINYKEIIFDGCSLVFGLFFYALCFNLFLTPNDLVVSGFSGVSIVMQKLFGWTPSVFLLIANVILLVICFIFLGWKTTKKKYNWFFVVSINGNYITTSCNIFK